MEELALEWRDDSCAIELGNERDRVGQWVREMVADRVDHDQDRRIVHQHRLGPAPYDLRGRERYAWIELGEVLAKVRRDDHQLAGAIAARDVLARGRHAQAREWSSGEELCEREREPASEYLGWMDDAYGARAVRTRSCAVSLTTHKPSLTATRTSRLREVVNRGSTIVHETGDTSCRVREQERERMRVRDGEFARDGASSMKRRSKDQAHHGGNGG